MNRRKFLRLCGSAVVTGTAFGQALYAREASPRHILLRSSWQTINIGDIAHTPGMLALLERHWPEATVTLWPNRLSAPVEKMLRSRFPRLRIAATEDEQQAALADCDFGLHGSGPGLVGRREMERWRETGKLYGFGGVTLSDDELRNHRELLGDARFVFCRDTLSLEALRKSGITGPLMEFGPDATFHLDLCDDQRAAAFLRKHDLQDKEFACFVPRLRWTP